MPLTLFSRISNYGLTESSIFLQIAASEFQHMKTKQILLLSAFFPLLLSACASEPERPPPPEGYFATYIEDDGTKKFQYTIDTPEQKKSGKGNGRPGNMTGHMAGSSSRGVSGGVSAGSGGGGRQAPSGGGYERFQQMNSRLENMLEQELKKSGFCHDGHRETQRVVEPPTVYIRGECEEAATDSDRSNFPNNID